MPVIRTISNSVPLNNRGSFQLTPPLHTNVPDTSDIGPDPDTPHYPYNAFHHDYSGDRSTSKKGLSKLFLKPRIDGCPESFLTQTESKTQSNDLQSEAKSDLDSNTTKAGTRIITSQEEIIETGGSDGTGNPPPPKITGAKTAGAKTTSFAPVLLICGFFALLSGATRVFDQIKDKAIAPFLKIFGDVGTLTSLVALAAGSLAEASHQDTNYVRQ